MFTSYRQPNHLSANRTYASGEWLILKACGSALSQGTVYQSCGGTTIVLIMINFRYPASTTPSLLQLYCSPKKSLIAGHKFRCAYLFMEFQVMMPGQVNSFIVVRHGFWGTLQQTPPSNMSQRNPLSDDTDIYGITEQMLGSPSTRVSSS